MIILDEFDDSRLKNPRDIILGVYRFNNKGKEILFDYL